MKIEEWMHGSGIYRVGLRAIGPNTWFLRKNDVEGKPQPLLHICERDKDATELIWICITGVVHWDQRGYYMCGECKHTFIEEDELAAVWEDGKGTGDEGSA